MFDAERFSWEVIAGLSSEDRPRRVQELEAAINLQLAGCINLTEFQQRLYQLIEKGLVKELGYLLWSWDYDCEIEYWGGQSYMNSTAPDELLLRSEYPHGVRLSWAEFKFASWE